MWNEVCFVCWCSKRKCSFAADTKAGENATSETWCNALLNDSYKNTAVASIEDYEVHNMSKKMKEIYLKYYSAYEEKRDVDTK